MKTTVLALIVLGTLASAAPAYAHGDVATSDPADGARLAQPPPQVSVRFTETPAADSRFIVKDGCGDEIGDPAIEGKSIVVAVADAQPGRWSVKWDVLSSEDGHQTTGSVSFKVKGRPDCSDDIDETPGDDIGDAAPPVANDDAGGGVPTIVIVGGIAGIALIALALLVRRSSGP